MNTKDHEPVVTAAPRRSKLLVGSTLALAAVVTMGLLILGASVFPAPRAEMAIETQPSTEIGPLAFRAVTRIRSRPRDLFDTNSRRALRADIRSSLAQAQQDLSSEFQSP